MKLYFFILIGLVVSVVSRAEVIDPTRVQAVVVVPLALQFNPEFAWLELRVCPKPAKKCDQLLERIRLVDIKGHGSFEYRWDSLNRLELVYLNSDKSSTVWVGRQDFQNHWFAPMDLCQVEGKNPHCRYSVERDAATQSVSLKLFKESSLEKTYEIVSSPKRVAMTGRALKNVRQWGVFFLLKIWSIFAFAGGVLSVKEFRALQAVPTLLANRSTVRVTGFARPGFRCPECPPGAVCEPCPGNTFILSDAPTPGPQDLVIALPASATITAGQKVFVEFEWQTQVRVLSAEPPVVLPSSRLLQESLKKNPDLVPIPRKGWLKDVPGDSYRPK